MGGVRLAHEFGERRAQRGAAASDRRRGKRTSRSSRLLAISRATNRSSRSEGSSAACRSSSNSTPGGLASPATPGSAAASKRRKRAPSVLRRRAARAGRGSARAAQGRSGRDPRRRHPAASAAPGLGLADIRAQRLHPGPVGRGAARLPAAADEDARPAGPRRPRAALRRDGSCRCPARRRAGTAPAAGERAIEASDQRGKLGDRGPRSAALGSRPPARPRRGLAGRQVESGSCASIARSKFA